MTVKGRDNHLLFTPASSGCKEPGRGFCEVQIHELEILVFTMGGITFGVDTAQVGGVITAAQAEELEIELVPFPDKIPLSGMPEHVQAPKALVIKDARPYAVWIGSPGDILSLGLDTIRPLPPLLTSCNPCQAIWGVAVREEGIIFLIDLLGLQDMHHRDNNAYSAIANKAGEAST